jgi:type IV pilus assembly protein PilB
MTIPDSELISLLLKANLISQPELENVQVYAKNSDSSLIDAIIEKNLVSDEVIGVLLADYFKFPFISLSKITIPEDVFRIVPEKVARTHKIVAFARDQEGIKLAMSDPNMVDIAEMISRKAEAPAYRYFATERDIYNALQVYKRDPQVGLSGLVNESTDGTINKFVKETPVAKIVDSIIEYAYHDKASDIHIEPEDTRALVRFRLDGILHDILYLPKHYHSEVINRIKVLSRLRTDEHYAPQDGKMSLKFDEEDLDVRVSIIPIVEGEKAVLRLLASHFRKFSLLDLGMNENDLKKVTTAFNKSYGMILSTGPTGSGKTTTIYAILKILNTREKNITTIEDPVEYRIKGVNQIQVNAKTNLTFASGLRSILRQDPNIVFVGEIRDTETAGIAVNAALTGHLVLSTLHTNDAATALPRFVDMEIEPFLVASTVNVIIAQRLVRRVCESCRMPQTIPIANLNKNLPVSILQSHFGDIQQITVYKGRGCKICHTTGYTGRVGVFEVLEVTKKIRDLLTKRSDSDIIARAAIEEGMTTMLDDGLEKVKIGTTTIEEVLRVTKVEL